MTTQSIVEEALAVALHDEMRFRIGIPDPHPSDLDVSEPTCQLLAVHLRNHPALAPIVAVVEAAERWDTAWRSTETGARGTVAMSSDERNAAYRGLVAAVDALRAERTREVGS